jgi:uncharacterized protein YdeI (YjbR/CyaY-like superfamily)
MHPKVDAFLAQETLWRAEFEMLRGLLLESGLSEELKWGKPCYTLGGKNVALIHGFKHYCAILFLKGALLKDPQSVLIQQTEAVQAARQLRFTHGTEITRREKIIKAFLKEAIALEKSGAEVRMKPTAEFAVPEELKKKFADIRGFRSAFASLTPGRQRAYLHYFAQAKRSQTRATRIENHVARILAGKGLDD